jgi:tetratricopeptide (TPR) repeat protein
MLAVQGGELAKAMALCQEIEALGHAIGDPGVVSHGLSRQGFTAAHMGDLARAADLAERGYALAVQTGDPVRACTALNALGETARRRRDFEGARRCYDAILGPDRPADVEFMVPYMYGNLAGVALDQGDLVRATTFCEQALTLFQRRNDRWGVGGVLARLARIARLRGERERSADLTREALVINRTIGSRPPIAGALMHMAWAARLGGDPIRSARLLGAAESIRESINQTLGEEGQRELDDEVAELRSGLGEAVLVAAWAEGHALSTDRAIRYALEEVEVY